MQLVRHTRTPCLELFGASVCVCEINRHTPKYYYKTVHLHTESDAALDSTLAGNFLIS
jgi:hypothetical protein